MKEKLLSIWNKVNNPKFYRYYAACVILVVIVLLLAFCSGGEKAEGTATSSDPMAGAYQSFTNETETKDSKKSSTTTESGETVTVQSLIEDYYSYYAAGDTNSLSTIARPITDHEISYIQFFSQYVENYEDIVVYTKGGLTEGSYLVSVTMKIKFVGIDTSAAGLDFFYVQTSENGDLYINNLYSSFNSNNGENDMDPDVTALITTFEQQEDFVKLQQEVQAEFEEAISADQSLYDFLTNTLSAASTDWATTYAAQAAEQAAAEQAAAEQAAAEQAAAEQAAAEQAAAEQEAAEQNTETAEAEESEDETESSESGTVTIDGLAAGDTVEMKDTVKIRSEQSTDSSVADTAYVYETVTIIENYESGWTKVRSVRGNEGYMMTEFLQ